MTNEEQNTNSTPAPETSVAQPAATPATQPKNAAATSSPTPPEAGTSPTAAPKPAKPAMAIGSQRDPADKSLSPSAPKAVQAAVANPISLSKTDQPTEEIKVEEVQVKSTAGLSDDIDAEIEAALGDISMDDVVSISQTADKEIEPGTRVKAPISKICLLYTSPSPRDLSTSRMPSSA